MASRILILGGSTEGFALAKTLAQSGGFEPVTSFAGRTKTRRPVAGVSRVGGFGGAEGLGDYLVSEKFSALIDATHPFAQKISENAQIAAERAQIPVLHIQRLPWQAQEADNWQLVKDMDEAANAIPPGANPTFLTVGRTELAPFAARRDIDFLARVIDPPEHSYNFKTLELVFERGPFTYEAEKQFFHDHNIACLVSKNSGGAAAGAKLRVARENGIDVIMIARPRPPGGEICATVQEAVIWLKGLSS